MRAVLFDWHAIIQAERINIFPVGIIIPPALFLNVREQMFFPLKSWTEWACFSCFRFCYKKGTAIIFWINMEFEKQNIIIYIYIHTVVILPNNFYRFVLIASFVGYFSYRDKNCNIFCNFRASHTILSHSAIFHLLEFSQYGDRRNWLSHW